MQIKIENAKKNRFLFTWVFSFLFVLHGFSFICVVFLMCVFDFLFVLIYVFILFACFLFYLRGCSIILH